MSMILNTDLNVSFDRMAVMVHDIERSCLNAGAYYLKEKVREAFISKFPAATKPVRQQTVSNGYKITKEQPLVDAVRQSKYANNTVKVHILGAGEAGSPLFMARFYEAGTQERYAKTIHGRKLSKPRRLGQLTGYHYFMPTVEQNLDQATNIIGQVYEHKIDTVFKDGQ